MCVICYMRACLLCSYVRAFFVCKPAGVKWDSRRTTCMPFSVNFVIILWTISHCTVDMMCMVSGTVSPRRESL